jgi:hypothetical protein
MWMTPTRIFGPSPTGASARRSPIGSAHHGRAFSAFEAALGLSLAVILMRRFKALWVRGLLAIGVAGYLAIPVFWFLQFGG